MVWLKDGVGLTGGMKDGVALVVCCVIGAEPKSAKSGCAEKDAGGSV